jgi:hypothetical protein
MTLPGKIIQVPTGLRGFDCNQRLSSITAKKFHDEGFRFAIRYVGRRHTADFDISEPEAQTILKFGLGLMLVQHVESPPWIPTGALGTEYGGFAALSAKKIGYHLGATVWCDLEGVKLHTDPRDVVQFCNNWHQQVGQAGFTPGLYVGYDPGLTASQLYYKLRFEHYWSAYNLNHDQFPLIRGVQMKQGLERELSGIKYDPDTVQVDLLGGLPLMLVDSEWTPE